MSNRRKASRWVEPNPGSLTPALRLPRPQRVPPIDKVLLTYVHPGTVGELFCRSLTNLIRRHPNLGVSSVTCHGGAIARSRDQGARVFLDKPDKDWLFFVDSDMSFEPNALELLLTAADPDERPVVGGLCFAQRNTDHDPFFGSLHEQYPTIFNWTGDTYEIVEDYPRDQLVQCDATGAAFLLIHREVLTEIADKWPTVFANRIDETGFTGEDMELCRRVRKLGHPVFVDTRVKTAHYKTCYLRETPLEGKTDG